VGTLLCVYAISAFYARTPNQIGLLGFLLTALTGLLLILGPAKVLEARARRKTRDQTYANSGSDAKNRQIFSRQLKKIMWVLYSVGLLWPVFSSRFWADNSPVLVLIPTAVFIGLGFTVSFFADTITLSDEIKAAKARRSSGESSDSE
jgi:hypothetical protein